MTEPAGEGDEAVLREAFDLHRATVLGELRTEVGALLDTLAAVPHDDHASPCTACLRDGFARVLDLLGP